MKKIMALSSQAAGVGVIETAAAATLTAKEKLQLLFQRLFVLTTRKEIAKAVAAREDALELDPEKAGWVLHQLKQNLSALRLVLGEGSFIENEALDKILAELRSATENRLPVQISIATIKLAQTAITHKLGKNQEDLRLRDLEEIFELKKQ